MRKQITTVRVYDRSRALPTASTSPSRSLVAASASTASPPRARPASSRARSTRRASPTRASRMRRRPTARRGRRGRSRASARARAAPFGRGRRRRRRASPAAVAERPRLRRRGRGRRRRGNAARSPSCVDVDATTSAPPNASAVARPIAATLRGMPVIRRRSSSAPTTLVRTTQSYPSTSTGSSPSGSTATSGTWSTRCPSAREPLAELLLAPGGPRDDDRGGAAGAGPIPNPRPPTGRRTVRRQS